MSSINVYIGRVIILINDRYPLCFEEIYVFEVKMDRKIFIRGVTILLEYNILMLRCLFTLSTKILKKLKYQITLRSYSPKSHFLSQP